MTIDMIKYFWSEVLLTISICMLVYSLINDYFVRSIEKDDRNDKKQKDKR